MKWDCVKRGGGSKDARVIVVPPNCFDSKTTGRKLVTVYLNAS